MARRSRRTSSSALSAWQTSLAAATTIAARTPILFTAAFTGSPKAVRESRRMVTEKAAAVAEGAMAASQAWGALWLQMATGFARPSQLARGLTSVMNAAVAPAQRTCKANARRLSRRRKK